MVAPTEAPNPSVETQLVTFSRLFREGTRVIIDRSVGEIQDRLTQSLGSRIPEPIVTGLNMRKFGYVGLSLPESESAREIFLGFDQPDDTLLERPPQDAMVTIATNSWPYKGQPQHEVRIAGVDVNSHRVLAARWQGPDQLAIRGINVGVTEEEFVTTGHPRYRFEVWDRPKNPTEVPDTIQLQGIITKAMLVASPLSAKMIHAANAFDAAQGHFVFTFGDYGLMSGDGGFRIAADNEKVTVVYLKPPSKTVSKNTPLSSRIIQFPNRLEKV